MSEVVLKAERRGTGKKAAKAVRNKGMVTGVYYRNGVEPIPIAVHPLSMRPIVYTADAKIVRLEIDGHAEALECMLKDISFDPVTDVIVHFDLFGVSDDAVAEFEVPVSLKGQSIGVRDGGKLEHALHKVRVSCLPKDLPEHIDLDITNLKIGQSIHLSDVNIPGLKLLGDPRTAIVAISGKHAGDAEAGA
jgi:large subunit ribosomal protein L25